LDKSNYDSNSEVKTSKVKVSGNENVKKSFFCAYLRQEYRFSQTCVLSIIF